MVYHVYSKSIANFIIFNNDAEYTRMLLAIRYYQSHKQSINLSGFIEQGKHGDAYDIDNNLILPLAKEKLVDIIAYCFMPTHIHLLLREIQDEGIPAFMRIILNSYTRYFNIKHGRKGPLWEGRCKKILIQYDDQLLHLTRYIHLNPVTAYITNKPEEWPYSSYKEYIAAINLTQRICDYNNFFDMDADSYRKFVEDRISYQRELAKIRSLTIE